MLFYRKKYICYFTKNYLCNYIHEICVCVCVCVCARILWTVACQAPLSMGFSRQEYCSGLPFLLPGDLPYPGIKLTSLMSLALAGGFFTISATWEAPRVCVCVCVCVCVQTAVSHSMNNTE